MANHFFLNSSGVIEYGGANTPGWVSNLGLTYSSNVFSITDRSGAALSTTNPAWVTVKSTTGGQYLPVQFTAPVTLQDSGHATPQFLGLFGTTASRAYGEEMPFFIGVVNRDNTSANAKFLLTRSPCLTLTPSDSNKIGKTGTSPVTNDQSNIIILDSSITVADYASKPVVMIGCWRATKDSSAGGSWLGQSLNHNMGIGQWGEHVSFTMAGGHFGAAASQYTSSTGPTGTSTNSYYIRRNGTIRFSETLDITGNGSGGGGTALVVPAVNQEASAARGGAALVNNAGSASSANFDNGAICAISSNTSTAQIAFFSAFTGITNPTNSSWQSGDYISITVDYQGF